MGALGRCEHLRSPLRRGRLVQQARAAPAQQTANANANAKRGRCDPPALAGCAPSGGRARLCRQHRSVRSRHRRRCRRQTLCAAAHTRSSQGARPRARASFEQTLEVSESTSAHAHILVLVLLVMARVSSPLLFSPLVSSHDSLPRDLPPSLMTSLPHDLPSDTESGGGKGAPTVVLVRRVRVVHPLRVVPRSRRAMRGAATAAQRREAVAGKHAVRASGSTSRYPVACLRIVRTAIQKSRRSASESVCAWRPRERAGHQGKLNVEQPLASRQAAPARRWHVVHARLHTRHVKA